MTILYVEDEPNDVLFMRLGFQALNEGPRLRDVQDGRTAMAYLLGEGVYADRAIHPLPQLVLLDLNLPSISGFDLLRWMRQEPSLKELPVVIFSSSGRPEDRSQAKELGADDYLLKPVSGAQFRDVARGLLERCRIR